MAASSYAEIAGWFNKGVEDKKAFMAVWCDTYDYTDYPEYFDSAEDCQEGINTNGQNMKRLMEVYDLSKDRKEQMDQHRCFAMRPAR